MIWFVPGFFVGGFIGMLGAALACAAGKGEDASSEDWGDVYDHRLDDDE